MTDDRELTQLINDFASDLAQACPIYELANYLALLAESLEAEVYKTGSDPDHPEGIEAQFSALIDILQDRVNKGYFDSF